FCPDGTFRGNDGYCYPYGNTCGPGEEFYGGRCVTACLPLFKRNNFGICISIGDFYKKEPFCQGGRVLVGTTCVCPPNRREVTGVSGPAKGPAQGPGPDGQVGRGGTGAGVGPPNRPDFSTGICRPKGAGTLPPCPDGQVRPGGTGACVCPPGRPDFSTGICRPKGAGTPPPACPDGQVQPGGTGQCVCPPGRPAFG